MLMTLNLDAIDHKPTDKTKAYVDSIVVDSSYRGKHIGDRLLEKAHELGRERGCTSAYLLVHNINPAIRLYERVGYKSKDQIFWGWYGFIPRPMKKLCGYDFFHRMEKPL
eukprot:Platyproteum_vivax@DN5717_c0_g1_i2.p1